MFRTAHECAIKICPCSRHEGILDAGGTVQVIPKLGTSMIAAHHVPGVSLLVKQPSFPFK